jgi:hypothetical protein
MDTQQLRPVGADGPVAERRALGRARNDPDVLWALALGHSALSDQVVAGLRDDLLDLGTV